MKRSVYWKNAGDGTPAKAEHAPPPKYEARWLIPLGLLAAAVAVVVSGGIWPGTLLLVAAAVGFGWVWRESDRAVSARAVWERQCYCTLCDVVFVPSPLVK